MRSTRWLSAGATVVFTLASSLSYAQGNGNGHAYGHTKHNHGEDDDDNDQGRGHYRDGYSNHDRDEFRRYYHLHSDRDDLPPGLAKRDRLPPGLERQLVRRGTLPPGLRKKYYRVPEELEERLPTPPPDYQHVVISGHIVLLNTKNFLILDVFHFER